MNEPGLYRDLKDIVLDSKDRRALMESLEYKEDWLEHFAYNVGTHIVQDVIEDLCLRRRVCEEKLVIEEKAHAVTMFERNILQGLIEKDKGDGRYKRMLRKP